MQIRLLREVLEWGEVVCSDSISGEHPDVLTVSKVVQGALRQESESGDIIVAVFPEGTLERLPNGTTAAKVIRDKVSGRQAFLSLNPPSLSRV